MKRNGLKTFQNIVAIFKVNSINFRFSVFICRASRICSDGLLISCAIIVVFSTRISKNLDLGIEWLLKCWAMELELLRCIVKHLERVIVVRPSYILFSLETHSPKGHLNIYMMFVLSRSSVEEGDLFEIIRLYICIYKHLNYGGKVKYYLYIFIA